MDPDPNKLYSRRKEERAKRSASDDISRCHVPVKYPEENWGSSLEKMPFFTRAEMKDHIDNSGKNIANKSNNSVPTSFRKAKTYLEDEYLHGIETSHDQRCFYFRAKCCHSFRKNDPPHGLKLAVCIITGDVLNALCSCVAGAVGYCNHILALMFKVCKYTTYECKSTNDLCQENDQNPTLACTSELQKWHKKGGGSNIAPEPVMNVEVNKTKLDDTNNSKRSAKSLLYEARVNVKYNGNSTEKLKTELKRLFPNMGLSQMADNRRPEHFQETKFGKCPVGSVLSYQLAFTESNFSAIVDLSAIPRTELNRQPGCEPTYPRFPLVTDEDMDVPDTLSSSEQALLSKLTVDESQINDIELKTRKQADCNEWKDQRTYRFTASCFHLIRKRKRNHDTFAKNVMYPAPFTSKYVEHGKKFESVALMEYQKFMKDKKKHLLLFFLLGLWFVNLTLSLVPQLMLR